MGRLQQIVEEAVVALTALDAHALERIQREIQELTAVPLASEDAAATTVQAHRLLGALLDETARNLRLFRAASLSARQAPDTGCYGFPLR